MRLDKVICEGGSLTLSEIGKRFGIRAKAAKDILDGLYPNVKSAILNGHTVQYPRVRYDGIHLSTGEELAKKADVCFLAITDIEFGTVVGVLVYQEELPSSGAPCLRRLIVGYRGDTVCLVGQAVEKRAFRAYGASRDLFAVAESCRFFFKIGGAAGRNEIGTIAILCRGPDGVVLHDRYMQQDIGERQYFPSSTALTFSHEQFEGLVVRSSATCGPKDILQFAESPNDTYEWEYSGVRIAADASLFGGELGMISVITSNYGCNDMNSLNVVQAFRKLADFVEKFLDSNMLA